MNTDNFWGKMTTVSGSSDNYGADLKFNKSSGFDAVFKERYEDFHVHEIDTDSKIQHITQIFSIEELQEEMSEINQSIKGEILLDPRRFSEIMSPEVINSLSTKGNFTTEDIERLSALLEELKAMGSGKTRQINPCYILGKQQPSTKPSRTTIHTSIREHFPFLTSEIFHSKEGYTCIKVQPKPESLKFLQTECQKAWGISIEEPKASESTYNNPLLDNSSDLRPKTQGRQKVISNKAHLVHKSSDRWPKDRPPWLHFKLYKENRDTADALSTLSTCLQRKNSDFSHAGTKDKRGITVQSVCCFKATPEDLKNAMTNPLWDSHIRLSDFQFKPERLCLGQLQGNYFRVALRHVPQSQKHLVETSFQSLQKQGFINYFGKQRFGTFHVKTHHVGKALLKNDFGEAVKYILSDGCDHVNKKVRRDQEEVLPDENATNEQAITSSSTPMDTTSSNPQANNSSTLKQRRKRALHVYIYQNDVKGAMRLLPRSFFIERCLLRMLDKNSTYIQSLLSLPRNVLSLYIHSAQSLIFNHMTTYRLKHYGMKAVVGDFVRPLKRNTNSLKNKDHTSQNTQETGERIYNESRIIRSNENTHQNNESNLPSKIVSYETTDDTSFENNLDNENNKVNQDNLDEEYDDDNGFIEDIHIISSEQECKRYNLWDVVLPIPGKKTQYPNYLKEAYEETCQRVLDIPLDKFNQESPLGLNGLQGGYRNIVVQANDLKWVIVRENENHMNSLKSDVDILKSIKFKNIDDTLKHFGELKSKGSDLIDINNTSHYEFHNNSNENTRWSVFFSCSLPKSSYLTVALNELLSSPV